MWGCCFRKSSRIYWVVYLYKGDFVFCLTGLRICVSILQVLWSWPSESLRAVQFLHSVYDPAVANSLPVVSAMAQPNIPFIGTFAFSPPRLQIAILFLMVVVAATSESKTAPEAKGIPADQLENAANAVNDKTLAVGVLNAIITTSVLARKSGCCGLSASFSTCSLLSALKICIRGVSLLCSLWLFSVGLEAALSPRPARQGRAIQLSNPVILMQPFEN